MKHIISAYQFTKEEVEKILILSEKMEKDLNEGKVGQPLQGKIVACVFFEPSTRTRLSFETAALRLGAQVISAEDAMANSSARKGESIEDTAKMLNCYADIIVMRHPAIGAVEKASKVSD